MWFRFGQLLSNNKHRILEYIQMTSKLFLCLANTKSRNTAVGKSICEYTLQLSRNSWRYHNKKNYNKFFMDNTSITLLPQMIK